MSVDENLQDVVRLERLSEQQRADLLQTALQYRERAYAPYSGFKVGAAVLSRSGTMYGGCNVENASYPASRCAEQTAVQKAISEGDRDIVAVAIVAEGEDVCTPCGVCRQIMSEFGSDVLVIMGNLTGRVEEARLTDLFPRSFRLEAGTSNAKSEP